MVCESCGININVHNSKTYSRWEGESLCIYRYCNRCITENRHIGDWSHSDNRYNRKIYSVIRKHYYDGTKEEMLALLPGFSWRRISDIAKYTLGLRRRG